MDGFQIDLGFAFFIAWLLLPIILLIVILVMRRKLKAARRDAVQTQERLSERDTEIERLGTRLSPISSIEEEVAGLEREADRLRAETEEIRKTYREKREVYDRLIAQVAVFDERLAFAELGVYEPHFDFNDSEAYESKISEIREAQKAMITRKEATHCPTDWTVDGSRSKGQAMINRQTRLTMRAFNGECEAAIANSRWNNVNAMEKRILNAAKQINAANASMSLTIDENYIALKLDELHATHEYREQQKIEKEERAELARSEREERKLIAEAEAAEREEQKYQALLDKARAEAGVGSSDAMQARIAELEAQVAAAHETSERARAMAEMTRSGYVYIISNIGSFGEEVVKIGLTRRLDPDDRVRELGDASVPFSFDTHAMIYSDEAPSLENALHREFAERRINASNMRKEFFRVSLEEVEDAVKRLAPTASFFKDREAQEWHETMARRNAALMEARALADEALPAEI